MRVSSRGQSIGLLLTALIVAFALVVTVGAQNSTDGNQLEAKPSRLQQVKMSMAKLFDFEFYKEIFHKSYSGVVEQMVRAKYYMARAMSVFVAALNYVNRKQSYYLSVNHMSDETASERSMRRNKVLDTKLAEHKPEVGPDNRDEDRGDDLLLDIPDLGENPYETLVELLVARKSDPYYAQMLEALQAMQQDSSRPDDAREILQHLMKHTRNKRSTDEKETEKRHLPVGMLMNLAPDADIGIPTTAADTNPSRQQAASPKPCARLMGDETRPFGSRIYNCEQNPANRQDLDKFMNQLRHRKRQQALKTTPWGLPNEVFLDHRDTKCFLLPRGQGGCGACYAFAAVSLMEYWYCRKTGQLAAFSEQYVVDCGKQYYPKRIMGCSGGVDEAAVGFFNDMGLELRTVYPYRTREGACPYEAQFERERAGFIKVDVKSSWLIRSKDFEEVLQRTPILVIVQTPDDFQEYGGGVHTCGSVAKSEGAHSMVLIGHGVEDNQEYWLMRNSFSVGWGEGGHFKLIKKATCLFDQGHIFGTSDSWNFDLVVKPNHKYDEHRVQIHHLVNTFKNQKS